MADSDNQLSTELQQHQSSPKQHSQDLLQRDSGQSQSKLLPTPKEVIAVKVTGIVKWFNVKSGYGFINRNDTKEDVFVHQSAIARNNPKKAVPSVGDGEVVVFDVVIGEKGNEAANVTGPSGEPVRGSQFAAEKRRKYRIRFGRRKLPGGNQNQGGGGGGSVSNQDQSQVGCDRDGELNDSQQSSGQQQSSRQRSYRRGAPIRGRGRRFNNYARNQQRRQGAGPGDGDGLMNGVQGSNHDQMTESMPRGVDGQRSQMRRGGPQRRFMRRGYGGGGGGMRPRGPPRSGNDDGNGGQGPQRRQRRNRKTSNVGGALSNMDQPQQQQDVGQEVHTTTTESNA